MSEMPQYLYEVDVGGKIIKMKFLSHHDAHDYQIQTGYKIKFIRIED